MNTIQQLWKSIQVKHEKSKSEQVLPHNYLYHLGDSMVRMDKITPDKMEEFCTALKTHPEYLAEYLTLKGDRIQFGGWTLMCFRDVRHRYLDLIKTSPMWQSLYKSGAFDSLEMLVIGDARGKEYDLNSLSDSEKEFCLHESMKMMPIPSGTFTMGASETDQRGQDQPQHKVTLTRDFLVGKYQVTQALWQSVMGSNPSHFSGPGRPVDSVTWFDAVLFCNRLSESEGRTPVYTIKGTDVTCDWDANGYRLLTGAEWEYCARANQSFDYSGGDSPYDVAWFDRDWDSEVWVPTGDVPHVVGQKKPNGFGLYDMSGNVEEWVWDWRDWYSGEDSIDPRGATTSEYRIVRGGSANAGPRWLKVSLRGSHDPNNASRWVGLRIMRNAT